MRMKLNTTCHITGFEKTVIATLIVGLFTQIPICAAIEATDADLPGMSNMKLTLGPQDVPENSLSIMKYAYVVKLDGDENKRWVVFFNDPTWKSLEGVSDFNSWTPTPEPFNERSILTVSSNGTNFIVPQGVPASPSTPEEEKQYNDAINKARLSVFGAFYTGENKTDLKNGVISGENVINAFNELFSHRTVALNLTNKDENPYIFYVADIYGVNNDFAGNVDRGLSDYNHKKIKTNNNSVLITLNGSAVLNFERIKGGKGVTWRDLTDKNIVWPWTAANSNIVYIKKNLESKEDQENFERNLNSSNPTANVVASNTRDYRGLGLSTSDINFYMKPSIIGGDAFETKNNIVYFENVITEGIDRKYGIVGGRAQDGQSVKPTTNLGADSVGNIVVVKNSGIGLINTKGQSSDNTSLNGTNIYGGLGYATAEENKVIISESKVQGNVQGGVSFLQNLVWDGSDGITVIPPPGMTLREYYDHLLAEFNDVNDGLTDNNRVYLDNAYLVGGSAVYASSGGIIFDQGGNPYESPFNNSQIVNFRLGEVIVNGENHASSVYASNVIFGERYDITPETLKNTVNNATDDQLISLELDRTHSKTISLGRSLAESFIRNSSGFHSTLSRQTVNQSNITNEKHNFWSNVTVNFGPGRSEGNAFKLSKAFDGSGTVMVDVPVVSKNETENKVVVDKETVYSLLKQDNVNGTKTYVAISSGWPQNTQGQIIEDWHVRALNLNWSRIIDYRLSTASGGRFVNAMDKDLNNGSYTNALLPFPELIVKFGAKYSEQNLEANSDDRYVWVQHKEVEENGKRKTVEIWYANKDDYTNESNGKISTEEKIEWLQSLYGTNNHVIKADITQKDEKVAVATYELAPYLAFGGLGAVGRLSAVGKNDGRLHDGVIYSVSPILESSVRDFVNTDPDGFVKNVDEEGQKGIVYKSRMSENVTYFYDQEKKEYYESVATEGDIVSITNKDLVDGDDGFGGIALVSKLVELEVNPGQTVQLNGQNKANPIKDAEGKDPLDSYTAEMLISGEGGILIPGKDDAASQGYAVRIDRSQQETEELEKNTYKGETVVGDGSNLDLWSNYALGETSSAVLGSGATINLYGTDKTQFVASFAANPKSDVVFNNNGTGTLEIGNGKDAGTLGRISGEGTVIINASSLELAGDYSKVQPTVRGSIQLKAGSNVFTDSTKLGWKQIGTSDIKLGDSSVLTINYDSGKEELEKGYGKRTLSGTGTLAIVNAEGSTIEKFVFPESQQNLPPAETFTGTLSLTRVNINLEENQQNLIPATLELKKGATAFISKMEENPNIGGITLNGGTLDYSSVKDSFGGNAISNVLRTGADKEFNFQNGRIIVDLTGNVPVFNPDIKGRRLLDQDDGEVAFYLGYGAVSNDTNLGNVGLYEKNGNEIKGPTYTSTYNGGEANLTYALGITDGSGVLSQKETEEGFGIGYRLDQVQVNTGKTLVLAPGDNNDQLSAKLISEGKTADNAGDILVKGDVFISNYENSLASKITVTKDAHLTANGGSLGKDLYSHQVTLLDKSTLTMQNGQQTIGCLEQKIEQSTIELTKGSNLILTKDSKSYGTVTGAGALTVQSGELEIYGSNNGFTGTLNIQNNASATTNKLESLGLSTVKVDKGGTLVLDLAEDATWSQVKTRAAGVRTVEGEGTVIKEGDGILVIDENYKLTGKSIVRGGWVQVGNKGENHPLKAQSYFVVEQNGRLRGFGSVAGLTNAGEVYMNADIRETSHDIKNTFVVDGDYVGQGGLLVFNANLASDDNSDQDMLIIKGNAKGQSRVKVENLHGEGAETDEGIDLIEIMGNSTANFVLDSETPLSVGAFNYQLFSTPDKRRWYLSTKNHIYRSEVGSYISAALASEQMNMRLHDRMGHSFVVDPASGEVYKAAGWVRQLGSHSHFRSGGNTTHMNTSLTQLGADLYRKKTEDDNNFIFGFFGGGIYSKSHTRSLDVSKGKTDGFALGVYGTYYTGATADDSLYVDTWLQYGRYDNKLYGNNNDFKYRSHGFSFSLETGLTIPLADLDEEGKTQFKMQPQAQIIVNGVKANNATDKSGTEYKQLGRNNVTLRLGSRFMIQKENGLTAFAEGNWIHNTKKAGVQMDSDSVYMEAGRNLGEFRVGFEGRLAKNLHGWLTGSIRGGKGGYHTESAQIGLKYQF